MPAKKKTALRRRAPKRKAPVKKRQYKKRSSNVSEYASLSVKRTIERAGQGGPFIVNTMYDAHNIKLADYARAVQVAQAYQFFRIKRVAITYKFGYDTFAAFAGAPTRPNLYYMLDKSQSIPANINLEGLRQMGARPLQCDNAPRTISWAPSVLTEEQTVLGATPAHYKISPWLNTNQANLGAFAASQVQHNGVYWWMNMDNAGGVDYNYTAEMEIQFEFKKPLWSSQSITTSTGIQVATLDTSPDGIVGGGDTTMGPSYLA